MFREDDRDVSFDNLREKIPQVRAVIFTIFGAFSLQEKWINLSKILDRNHQKLQLEARDSRNVWHYTAQIPMPALDKRLKKSYISSLTCNSIKKVDSNQLKDHKERHRAVAYTINGLKSSCDCTKNLNWFCSIMKTVGQLLADGQPTVDQQLANSWFTNSRLTDGQLSADKWPTVSQLLANRGPTVPFGNCSSLLPMICYSLT